MWKDRTFLGEEGPTIKNHVDNEKQSGNWDYVAYSLYRIQGAPDLKRKTHVETLARKPLQPEEVHKDVFEDRLRARTRGGKFFRCILRHTSRYPFWTLVPPLLHWGTIGDGSKTLNICWTACAKPWTETTLGESQSSEIVCKS